MLRKLLKKLYHSLDDLFLVGLCGHETTKSTANTTAAGCVRAFCTKLRIYT